MTDLNYAVYPHSLLNRLKGSRLSGNSIVHALFHFLRVRLWLMRCRHSQDRASMPSALRKIKPQRAQRITESCYFYLLPPLRHSVSFVSSVVFRNFVSKTSKVPEVLVTATRDIKDPGLVASGDNYDCRSIRTVEAAHG